LRLLILKKLCSAFAAVYFLNIRYSHSDSESQNEMENVLMKWNQGLTKIIVANENKQPL